MDIFFFSFFRKLPGDLVTVVNHLNSILTVDSRLAEVNLKIVAAYGHPAPFKSKRSYQIWVSVCDHVQVICDVIAGAWGKKF